MLCLRFLDVLRTHAADSSRKFKVAYETAQHLLRHWYLLFVVNTGSKTDGEYEVQESCTRCCPIQRMYLGFPLYLGPSLWNGSSKDHCSISSPSIDICTVDLQMLAGNWLGSFMDATWSRSRGWSYGFWDLNFC